MGVVVGAPVAIGVGPLSVRYCRVGSEVVRFRLRIVYLWGSDEFAQAVEEERGPAPSHVVAPPSFLCTRHSTRFSRCKLRSVIAAYMHTKAAVHPTP